MKLNLIGTLAVGIAVGALTWLALNAGTTLYKDWQFLHAARLYAEAAQAQQARQPQSAQPPAK